MKIFSNITNSEYERVNNKISDLKTDIELLKTKIETLTTNQNSLRGLINRKLGKEEQVQETQCINMPFPFNSKAGA